MFYYSPLYCPLPLNNPSGNLDTTTTTPHSDVSTYHWEGISESRPSRHTGNLFGRQACASSSFVGRDKDESWHGGWVRMQEGVHMQTTTTWVARVVAIRGRFRAPRRFPAAERTPSATLGWAMHEFRWMCPTANGTIEHSSVLNSPIVAHAKMWMTMPPSLAERHS
jgi:hypothetical protein